MVRVEGHERMRRRRGRVAARFARVDRARNATNAAADSGWAAMGCDVGVSAGSGDGFAAERAWRRLERWSRRWSTWERAGGRHEPNPALA